MLIKSMAWRKQYNIDAHLDIWAPPPIIEKYLPGAWHRNDKGKTSSFELYGQIILVKF